MTDLLTLIAQATSAPGGPPAGAPATPGSFIGTTIIPMILIFVVFYWIMFRGQRKERDKHANMLKALKRNDRVQTIGGIYATVVEVRDNEVVLKVDETNNVKMRFNLGAIKEVIAEAPPEKK